MFKGRKTLRNGLLAVALTGAATLMAGEPAQADVMASSMVDIHDFVLLGSDGQILDDSDFAALTFTTSANIAGALTGFGSFADSDSSGTASIDLPAQCVGDGCGAFGPAENTFPKPVAPPVGNYAAADQLEEGAPISGLEGFVTPARIAQGSYAGLVDITASGSSESNNNLQSSFIFELEQSQGVTFEFNADAWLQVAVTADEQFPGFATASYLTTFSITNLATGATVFTFSPDLFGDGTQTLSINAPTFTGTDIEITRDATGAFFSSTTPLLLAGVAYQASFRSTSEVDVERGAPVQVPQPAALSLLGLGLLGLGVIGLRRRKRGTSD